MEDLLVVVVVADFRSRAVIIDDVSENLVMDEIEQVGDNGGRVKSSLLNKVVQSSEWVDAVLGEQERSLENVSICITSCALNNVRCDVFAGERKY